VQRELARLNALFLATFLDHFRRLLALPLKSDRAMCAKLMHKLAHSLLTNRANW
jgi:hypothetical protein